MDFIPVLQRITPAKKEEKLLAQAVRDVTKKIRVKHAVPMLGGSGAKRTWLKSTNDIDVYVKFKYAAYHEKSGQLADILHAELKKKFPKVKRLHGSRDYFHIHHLNFTFEIVPILDIAVPSQAKNITDCSQLHVRYVLGHIKKNRQLANEIRLTKQFAKANHVYGAESYIRGFSGYVVELLTIHYGSFTRLIRAAAKWKAQTIIGSKAAAKRLNPSKKAPLILIDPMQQERNACAALSEEKYYDFIMASRAFMRHPSLSFFHEKPIMPEELERLGTLICLPVKPSPGNRDVVGAKLLKAFVFIRDAIRHHGFSLLASKWSFDHEKKSAVFYYVVNRSELSPSMTLQGPPTNKEEAVKAFKKKHAKTMVQGNRICAVIKRPYQKIDALVKDAIMAENVASRVKGIALRKINAKF